MNNSIFYHEVLENNAQLVEWFKHLHMYPELPFEEHQTTKYIIEQLKEIPNIEIFPLENTGLVATLKGAHSGKVIALRADIDALPILEETEIDYKSKNDGVMHACGHDAHTSILLMTAKILASKQDQIHGEIRFVFQPAEEKIPGGALQVIESGYLEGIDFMFGLHLMSFVPTDGNV